MNRLRAKKKLDRNNPPPDRPRRCLLINCHELSARKVAGEWWCDKHATMMEEKSEMPR